MVNRKLRKLVLKVYGRHSKLFEIREISLLRHITNMLQMLILLFSVFFLFTSLSLLMTVKSIYYTFDI
jgi:hypothetical protein